MLPYNYINLIKCWKWDIWQWLTPLGQVTCMYQGVGSQLVLIMAWCLPETEFKQKLNGISLAFIKKYSILSYCIYSHCCFFHGKLINPQTARLLISKCNFIFPQCFYKWNIFYQNCPVQGICCGDHGYWCLGKLLFICMEFMNA